MKKQKQIYPCFNDVLICVDTFRKFTKANEYRIVAFGTEYKNKEKFNVWFLKNTNNQEKEFSVVKTTVNTLIKSGTLKLN